MDTIWSLLNRPKVETPTTLSSSIASTLRNINANQVDALRRITLVDWRRLGTIRYQPSDLNRQMTEEMTPTDPKTWKCPADWHADFDGPWEFDQLRALASQIVSRPGRWSVYLDYSDLTVLFFHIYKKGAKFGEAYVNRDSKDSSTANFSVFAGLEQEEYHGCSLRRATEHLEKARGEWSGV